MRLGLRKWAMGAVLAALALTLFGAGGASAQRGLYKGWLAPAKYRTTEERWYTYGGGLPTGRHCKKAPCKPWPGN